MTKLAESKVIVGLEVGSHKVVAVVGEVLPDGVVNVIGLGVSPTKGMKSGGVLDLEAVVQSIERAVEEAESVSESTIMAVTVAISGEHILAFNEKGTASLPTGEVRQVDIDEAVKVASSIKLPANVEILHMIPQEYRVDRLPLTKNPIGLSGMRLEAQVHIITCHSDWLRNLKNAVERSKLKIDKFVFSGIASTYSALTKDEKDLGVCLLDIGGGTMEMSVYTDGALRFNKVFPYAGNDVTDHIAQHFSTSRMVAENTKVQYGSAICPPSHFPEKKFQIDGLGGRIPRTFTKEQLSNYTARCYHDLLDLVAKELAQLRNQLYQQGINQELIAGIVLTGGGSQMEDIVECAKSVFQSQVRVACPQNISGLTDYVNKPQYVNVLGLLQYTFYNDVESSQTNDENIINKLWYIAKRVVEKTYDWTKKNY